MKIVTPVRPKLAWMDEYHAPNEGRAGKLRLDFNENTVGCSPAVREALASLTPEQVAMYPEYEAARKRLGRFFGVASDELILTNGGDEGLRLLFDAWIEPGSIVLLVEPTFSMYLFYAKLAGATVWRLRYDNEMRYPLEKVEKLLCAKSHSAAVPKILFLPNPNNPTGTLLREAELRRILDAARYSLVLVDEAYAEYSGLSVIPWIREYPNLVVLRTFSKASGMAGLRLGCLLANRDAILALRRVQPPYSVNTPALVAAEAAARDGAYTQHYVDEVRQARTELAAALAELSIPAFPSAANFLLADFGSRAPQIIRKLRRQGILLRDRQSDFHRVGYVRITVGTREQTQQLVSAIRAAWKRKSHAKDGAR